MSRHMTAHRLLSRVFAAKDEPSRAAKLAVRAAMGPEGLKQPLLRDGTMTRIRNECTVTGRKRFVITPLRVSRIVLREKWRDMPNVEKATW